MTPMTNSSTGWTLATTASDSAVSFGFAAPEPDIATILEGSNSSEGRYIAQVRIGGRVVAEFDTVVDEDIEESPFLDGLVELLNNLSYEVVIDSMTP